MIYYNISFSNKTLDGNVTCPRLVLFTFHLISATTDAQASEHIPSFYIFQSTQTMKAKSYRVSYLYE